MCKRTRLLAAWRIGRRASAVVIATAGLQACVSGLHAVDQDYVEEPPVLIGDDRPVTVPRREIDRYRCASGAVLQCSGPSDALATCICTSGPTLPWVPL